MSTAATPDRETFASDDVTRGYRTLIAGALALVAISTTDSHPRVAFDYRLLQQSERAFKVEVRPLKNARFEVLEIDRVGEATTLFTAEFEKGKTTLLPPVGLFVWDGQDDQKVLAIRASPVEEAEGSDPYSLQPIANDSTISGCFRGPIGRATFGILEIHSRESDRSPL